MKISRSFVLSLAAALLFVFASSAFSEINLRHDWPVRDVPIAIANLAYTLQFYGDKPGFHHGLDILEKAGTPVYAPVSGTVSVGYYYPRYKLPYTYEIAIHEKNGTVWQFHHLDPQTIPASLMNLAAKGGTLSSGALLGKIYDASQMGNGISPHVHVNVIDANGYYQEPLQFFPPLKDNVPPVIQGLYLIDSSNRVLADDQKGVLQSNSSPASALVVDAFDRIAPSPVETSLASIQASALVEDAADKKTRKIILANRRFERLPGKDFFTGVSEIYQIPPLAFPDGHTLTNQVNNNQPRKFLYRFPLSKLHALLAQRERAGASLGKALGSGLKNEEKVLGFEVIVQDFAGNRRAKIWIFPNQTPRSLSDFRKTEKWLHSLHPTFY